MAPPSANHVVETRLNNGLQSFWEDHSPPDRLCLDLVPRRSRNEQPGKTGLSHWVEHMQFKGTRASRRARFFGTSPGWEGLSTP